MRTESWKVGSLGWCQIGVADESVFNGASIGDISHYPTFDLQIPGALLHFPPQLYFLKEDGRYTLQIVQNNYEVVTRGFMEGRIRCKWVWRRCEGL